MAPEKNLAGLALQPPSTTAQTTRYFGAAKYDTNPASAGSYRASQGHANSRRQSAGHILGTTGNGIASSRSSDQLHAPTNLAFVPFLPELDGRQRGELAGVMLRGGADGISGGAGGFCRSTPGPDIAVGCAFMRARHSSPA